MKSFYILILSSILFVSNLFSLTLKDKLQSGKEGDFVVVQQGSNYSLLSIRSLNKQRIILEEITVPTNQIKKTHAWRSWVEQKAPDHTSWVMYEIDLLTDHFLEGYSFTSQNFLYFDQTEHFFLKMFSLPLIPIPHDLKRKVGPSPTEDADRRPLWAPALIVDGKKTKDPRFETVQTNWPKDGSLLAGHRIEFYFNQKESFPFPYWMQVDHNHYGFKIHAVDSGRSLHSPQKSLPHRAPQFLGRVQKQDNLYRLFLRSPLYYSKLLLFALDISDGTMSKIPILVQAEKRGKDETVLLEITQQALESVLKKGHKYHFIVVPENESDLSTKSLETFLFS